MKTLNFSTFKKLSILAIATLAFSACSKKGGSAPVNPYAGVYANCPTCAQGTIPLLNTVNFQHGSSQSYLDGAVTILGENNGSADMNDPKAIVHGYKGNISVIGQLRINVAGYFCNAATGIYNVTPLAPAMSDQGVIMGLRLQAVHQSGASQIILEAANSSQVYSTNANTGVYRESPDNRIGMNLNMTVNGQPCGTISTF